ncbi:MAG: hypothetical protein KatS3mg102_2202 [Planctomycetota bacterium]|nr:MAG: hypothetical protein KatS3mg102_2202 [Planctomycetota bacterium]
MRARTLLVWLAVIALLVDLGSYHRSHHGDSLVPVLMSLQHWTPFFWEQDRFFMLVPLLALPFRDPLANLLVQSALGIFAGLGAYFAVGHYALAELTDRRLWQPSAALALCLFVAFASDNTALDWFGAQPYGVSLALGGWGLVLARAGRVLVGAVLLVLALLVNPAALFVLGPLVVGWRLLAGAAATAPAPSRPAVASSQARRQQRRRAAREHARVAVAAPSRLVACSERLVRLVRRERPTAWCLGLLLGGFAVSLFASRAAEYRMAYAILPPAEWPACWWGLLRNAWRAYLADGLAAAMAAGLLVGVIAAALGRRWRALRQALAAAALLAASGAACVLVMGALNWPKLNDLAPRYILPAVALWLLGSMVVATGPLLALLSEPRRRLAAAAAAAPLLVVALLRYGVPSLQGVRADLDRSLGARTQEVIDSGATHVIGDYWKVWPTVFHVNLVLASRGSERRVWGVTHRSLPTRHLWLAVPRSEMRFAMAADDDPRRWWWSAALGLPPLEVERRLETIVILRPAAAAAGSPGRRG